MPKRNGRDDNSAATALESGECPTCGESLKYDGGNWTCPEGHGSFATEIRRLAGDMRRV